MKRYKVFPSGFDPMVAAGPPPDYMIKIGETWTPEETQQALELEEQFEIVTVENHTFLPKNRWYMEIDDENNSNL